MTTKRFLFFQGVKNIKPHPSFKSSSKYLDRLAKAVYFPGKKSNQDLPYLRPMARLFQSRRKALGLFRLRKADHLKRSRSYRGHYALHRLRIIFGEKVWQDFLHRADIYAAIILKEDSRSK